MSKKEKIKKTNVMRQLDTQHVAYNVFTYEWEEGHQSGLHAAMEIGIEADRVFKTLVAYNEHNEYVVFCIPVGSELHMKKAARVSGHKSIHMLPLKDLLSVTGYMRGGCSPVGMKKLYATYFDESMKKYEKVVVSAGQRGFQMEVNPHELARIVNGVFGDIIS